MTDQPIPIPADDPAAAAAEKIHELLAVGQTAYLHQQLGGLADVTPVKATEPEGVRVISIFTTIIRDSYAPILAAVRDLLTVIQPGLASGEGADWLLRGRHAQRSLIQQCADAAEVVTKERAEFKHTIDSVNNLAKFIVLVRNPLFAKPSAPQATASVESRSSEFSAWARRYGAARDEQVGDSLTGKWVEAADIIDDLRVKLNEAQSHTSELPNIDPAAIAKSACNRIAGECTIGNGAGNKARHIIEEEIRRALAERPQ